MKHLKKIFCLSIILSLLCSVNVSAQNIENPVETDMTDIITMSKYDLTTGEIEEEVYQENKNLTDSSTFLTPYTPFSIIGDDDRWPLDYTGSFPSSAIGKLEITAPNGKTCVGTGFLVSDDLVLTAGHCLESNTMGGHATKIVFKAGQHFNGCIASANATEAYLPAPWKQSRDVNWDWALLRLDKKIGAQIGYITCIVEDAPNGKRCEIFGYPIDYDYTIQVTGGGFILASTKYKFYYDADTLNGMSGGPVFLAYGQDGIGVTLAVAGIHTNGTSDTQPYNSGVRITSSLLTVLNNKK